ncbi:hypothetical protein [Pontiella sp.]|uniref:hypothetical protein n=1 Tax=Pontiella sp. TaxID=2837462 RepID=UPI0035639888
MKCNHCKKDIPTAQAVRAVERYLKSFPPTVVPQAVAARVLGISPQLIHARIKRGLVETVEVYGDPWVCLADFPEYGKA